MTRKTWVLIGLAAAVVAVAAVGLAAHTFQRHRIQETAVLPAYIVVNEPTDVLFTVRVNDDRLKKETVLLVRTDAEGKTTDILGRMHDDGKNGDTRRSDDSYALKVSLNEQTVGPIYFKVVARFVRGFPFRFWSRDRDDHDWDKDLGELNDSRFRSTRYSKLQPILHRLVDYEVSGLISVSVWYSAQSSTGELQLKYSPSLSRPW